MNKDSQTKQVGSKEQQEAERLIDLFAKETRFYFVDAIGNACDSPDYEAAKACAAICVKEILKVVPTSMYWNKVLNHINQTND